MTIKKLSPQAILLGLLWILLAGPLNSRILAEPPDLSHEKETDPMVLKKLEWFQDMKFGLMLHWGPYSQWGVVESWSICSEDETWCKRNLNNYVEYCQNYEALKNSFNPLKFNPALWAEAAKAAGMKYVVFTTKHHDGFCMFDTRQTDYRITDPGCPFSNNPKANATKEIFSEFRNQGFGLGAYFSKPDWHSPWYWDPYWAHADRNVNYKVEKYREKWQKFSDYTYNQIEELMTGYGSVDILWLDGGWVNPGNRGQDVGIPRIAAMARNHQPGLIVVDRAVPGRYENYRTPEQEVPERPLDKVWESCMTMGNQWSYNAKDIYKPASKLIHLLVEIISKGGNFLLNIGPSPEGELPGTALERLKEIGSWMDVNGSAIYATRPVAPYREGKIAFTRSPNGQVNAIYLADEAETQMPATIELSSFAPREETKISLLGSNVILTWEKQGEGVVIRIPEATRQNPPCRFAWTFTIENPA